MSLKQYSEVLEDIRAVSDNLGFFGGCSHDLVVLAQETLDVIFPHVYRMFLEEFGASYDVYGLIDESFDDKFRPDAVGATLSLRNEWDLPSDLVVINEVGDGEYLCLRCNTRVVDDSPVIAFMPGLPIAQQPFGQVEDSFSAFLLTIYRRHLRRRG